VAEISRGDREIGSRASVNLGVEPYVIQRQLRSLRTTSRASNNKNSHDSRSPDLPVKSRNAETPTAGEGRDETNGESSARVGTAQTSSALAARD